MENIRRVKKLVGLARFLCNAILDWEQKYVAHLGICICSQNI
jgi:hypothetical protein